MLRGLRPLALPLLNRLQLRMRRVVEEADLGAATQDLADRLERVEAHLRGDAAATMAHLRELRLGMDAIIRDQEELRGLRHGLETILRDQPALAERIEARLDKTFGPLETRMRSLQIGLDALRLDQASANRGLEERIDRRGGEVLDRQALDREALGEQLRQVAAGMEGLVEARAEMLQGRVEGLTGFVGDRTDQLRGAVENLTGFAGERTDLLRSAAENLTGLVGDRTDLLRSAVESLTGLVGERMDLLRGTAEGLTGLVGERTELLLRRVAVPLGDAVLMRMPEGYLLVPTEDVALLIAMVESGGRLEPGTVAVMQAILREGDVVLDVGANIGLTVIPAARRVGTSGRVIAVEPASRVMGLLRRSLAMDGLDGRVTLHACAAGEAAGRAVLNIGPISGHSSLLGLPGAERTEEVEVRALDELVEPGTPVRLVKIDVEGYEPEAWRGMRRIVAENPALAVLAEFGPEHLRRAGISPEDWMGLFTGAGFTAFEVEEATGMLRPVRPVGALALLHSVNLLMLRQPPSAYPELRFA
jgi:FkbM family methyltransferase